MMYCCHVIGILVLHFDLSCVLLFSFNHLHVFNVVFLLCDKWAPLPVCAELCSLVFPIDTCALHLDIQIHIQYAPRFKKNNNMYCSKPLFAVNSGVSWESQLIFSFFSHSQSLAHSVYIDHTCAICTMPTLFLQLVLIKITSSLLCPFERYYTP